METVTINLDTYNEMKETIRRLEIEVQQKTIEKPVLNKFPAICLGILLIIMMIGVMSVFINNTV